MEAGNQLNSQMKTVMDGIGKVGEGLLIEAVSSPPPKA